MAARSALARLVNSLKLEPHDYWASLEIFSAPNVAKIAADVAFGKTGARTRWAGAAA
jgi:hypothetical protein